jgi:DNA polymerase elongation subunit (family B)
MYRNAVYNSRNQSIHLFTWDNSGNRVSTTASLSPYLYVEDPRGEKTTIYGTKAKKRIFRTTYDKNKFISDSGIKRIYENFPAVQQYLLDVFWTENEKPEFSQHPLKIMFLDIETYSPDKFPDVDDPTHTINVITCYDSFSKKFFTFGLKPHTTIQSNVIYTHCKDEKTLLIKFIDFFKKDYPDVLSGWNSDNFDIPYIINRCARVLGEEKKNELSPLRNIYFRAFKGKFGRDQKRYYIDGISCIDYLDIYRRFCLKLRESYKLDAIGEIELGERKVDYGDMDLATLSVKDWQTFVEYNIQDVNLLVRLEEKLQYISLLRMLAYVGLTTLEGAMGTISIINGALAIKARKNNEILSTFIRKEGSGKNPGAYVAEPKTGFKKNIVSFDANSLYPNVMISLNLSPETKIGRVEKTQDGNIAVYHVSGRMLELTPQKFAQYMQVEQCTLTKAGFLFTQKKKGIIPEFLDYYYSERVKVKEDLFKVRQRLSSLKKDDTDYVQLQYEMDRLNTKQMVIKILCNSVYGYMGNKQAPIGDDDIAASVTLTGQAVIKQAGKLVQQHLEGEYGIIDKHVLEDSWVYSDTDSVYFSLDCIEDQVPIKRGENINPDFYSTVQKLEDYLNNNIALWAQKSLKTQDSRFVFKRECISDVGLFLQKKRYVLHVLDEEGIKVDKFKYTGVEVVRTTMPNAIKPYAKSIIETMLLTQSLEKTNNVLNEAYEKFKELSVEELAFVMGLKGYEKYAKQCKDFKIQKGTPIHVKAAYLHNMVNAKHNLQHKYENITSGDKIRYFRVEQPNKYGIEVFGFKYNLPEEYKELFKVDYELMFEKILFKGIERFYHSVNWQIRKPSENVRCDFFDLFGLD